MAPLPPSVVLIREMVLPLTPVDSSNVRRLHNATPPPKAGLWSSCGKKWRKMFGGHILVISTNGAPTLRILSLYPHLPTHQCILEKSFGRNSAITIPSHDPTLRGYGHLKWSDIFPVGGHQLTLSEHLHQNRNQITGPRWCLPVDSWPSGATRCNRLLQLSIFVSIPQLERAALCPFSAIP